MLEENKLIWYVVGSSGVKKGPFSDKKIQELLNAGKLTYEHFLFSSETQETHQISEISFFERRGKANSLYVNNQENVVPAYPKSGEPPIFKGGIMTPENSLPVPEVENESVNISRSVNSGASNEWFLYLENQQKGPYSLEQIQKMLNDGKVHYTDYIYKNGQEKWEMIAEHSNFNRRKGRGRDWLPPTKPEDLTNIHYFDIETTKKLMAEKKDQGTDSLVDYFAMLKQKEIDEKNKERTKTIDLSMPKTSKFSFIPSPKFLLIGLGVAAVASAVYFGVFNNEATTPEEIAKQKNAKAGGKPPVTTSKNKDYKAPDDYKDIDTRNFPSSGRGENPSLKGDEYGDIPDFAYDEPKRPRKDFGKNTMPGLDPNSKTGKPAEKRPGFDDESGFAPQPNPPTGGFDNFGSGSNEFGFKPKKGDDFDIPPPPPIDDFDSDWID